MENPFAVLKRKEIYEFLEGSGDNDLVTYNGKQYGLPYHSAASLEDMCRSFGYLKELGGSRWNYVCDLLQFAIEKNRGSEFLKMFFGIEQFDNLKEIGNMPEIERVHALIVQEAIKRINQIIILSRKELSFVNGEYYITEVGKRVVVQAPMFEGVSIKYIHDLTERCDSDFLSGNYDSVITKSRTLIEETLIHILEKRGIPVDNKGDINKLYGHVKLILNMKQQHEFDKRVNGLLSGLEKIISNITEMRNTNSDAHGVGSKRISIRKREARLVMNSAMVFCEYLLDIE